MLFFTITLANVDQF